MVALSALWIPILLSAVIVFVASSILHMVLPYHRSDYKKLPDEDKVVAVLRSAGLSGRGLYMFPYCTHKEMKSPEMLERFKQGPVGTITVFPGGPVSSKSGKAECDAETTIRYSHRRSTSENFASSRVQLFADAKTTARTILQHSVPVGWG